MDLQTRQHCTNDGEYTEVGVPSRSDPSVVYNVLVIDAEDPEETICECDGFLYRGHCAHQELAHDTICGWVEGDEEEQTEEQREQRICPACGSDTTLIMVDVDE